MVPPQCGHTISVEFKLAFFPQAHAKHAKVCAFIPHFQFFRCGRQRTVSGTHGERTPAVLYPVVDPFVSVHRSTRNGFWFFFDHSPMVYDTESIFTTLRLSLLSQAKVRVNVPSFNIMPMMA